MGSDGHFDGGNDGQTGARDESKRMPRSAAASSRVSIIGRKQKLIGNTLPLE